jgi:chromosome segregation ATPase
MTPEELESKLLYIQHYAGSDAGRAVEDEIKAEFKRLRAQLVESEDRVDYLDDECDRLSEALADALNP